MKPGHSVVSSTRQDGVVLGSNIGTTFGAELIAFQISKYAPLGLACCSTGMASAGRSCQNHSAGALTGEG